MKTLRYRRKRKGDFISYIIFTCFDSLAIGCAFLLAYQTRFIWFSSSFTTESTDPARYTIALLVILIMTLWSFRQHQIYIFDRLRRRLDEIYIILRAIVIAAVVLMALTFIYRDFSYSRVVFFLHFLYSFFLICLFRHFAYLLDGAIRNWTHTRIKVLILGANRSARHIVRRIQRSYRNRYEVVGVLSGGRLPDEKHFESIPVLGTLDDAIKRIDSLQPDEVILTVSDYPEDKLTQLFFKCENELITFLKIPDLFGIFTSGVDVHYIDNVPLIGIKKSPLDKMGSRVLKRAFDFAASTTLLITTTPLMGLLAILVKATDGGPIFYKQERVGMDGRSFLIYKFRTMKVNAESETGPIWAKKNDERTTRIGKWLRRYNLDEIPQIWNVVRGDMSLVGPRPERPHFVGKFRADVPRYMVRHKIKSGITGWAQVNGLRGDTSIAERTKYDLYYYENWSIFLDLKILFLTLFAFKNAY